MCGIAGVYQAALPEVEIVRLLDRMSAAMIHRGPDEQGSWTASELRSGLAACRLSIVDLVTGKQPLLSEDGSVALVSNGEIYNHKTLRRQLEERGHRFRSRSDCEVILHLYEDHGVECLKHLNGMFGLAILDRGRRRLLLARDPAGMKPIYYARTSKGFLFASEAKALLASAFLSAAPDWEGLNLCLAARYIPAPRTCFRGVERLPAGAFLLLEEGREMGGNFWTARFHDAAQVRSEREYAEELERRLRGAVASHLAADVPVGAFVSGGWDSSLIAVFAAEIASRPLKTFSLVFPEEPKENEARYSRALARHISSEHHEVEFRTGQIPELIRKVVGAVEEPCTASPSPLLYQLSAAAGKEVKAVIGGEGADELFGGYTWFRRDWLYRVRRLAPRPLLRPLADRVLSPGWGRLWRLLAADSDRAAHLERVRCFTGWQKRWFFNPDLPLAEEPDLEPWRPPSDTLASCRDRLEERLSLDFTRRLPEGLLFVEDKVSMAHSLEVRLPYLDRDVVDLALSMPSSMKLRNGQEKYVLSLLGRHLPPEIAKRRKYGLHFPMLAAPAGRFSAFLREVLLESPRRPELFHRRHLEPWLTDVLAGRRRGMDRAWPLVFLAVWWDCFLSAP
jgi:asparagine synthase (glutamine-hydrolysing)